MGRLEQKFPPTAVRLVELSQPLPTIDDIAGYRNVRVYVALHGRVLGYCDIYNCGAPITPDDLRGAISAKLALKLLDARAALYGDERWTRAIGALVAAAEGPDYRPDPTDPAVVAIEPAHLQVELSQPLQPLPPVAGGWPRVRVMWQGATVGYVTIADRGEPIAVERLHAAILDNLGVELLAALSDTSRVTAWSSAVAGLEQRLGAAAAPPAEPVLPPDVPVSIVVATYDRPDDLRACLRSLVVQLTPRPLEIVVVDNHPASGLTAPVVAEFPGVLLVEERRQGLAYARNTGFAASSGAIAIATDDDVIAPPEWVERLVAPFARSDVMVVTGNVLPLELETPAQHLFEAYGGLGRGFDRFEVGRDWFESFRFKAVPTWTLGATANAAFRTAMFADPRMGLMDEALGPGMPSGVGEDTYLFYKALKAGYTVVYEPGAHVWHKHRRTMQALERQLYHYSKGAPGYHLTTACNDGDLRGLFHLLVMLPIIYRWRLNEWRHRRTDYTLGLLLLELRGNLAGVRGIWEAWGRVRREGRSTPYVPVEQRPADRRGQFNFGRNEALPLESPARSRAEVHSYAA